MPFQKRGASLPYPFNPFDVVVGVAKYFEYHTHPSKQCDIFFDVGSRFILLPQVREARQSRDARIRQHREALEDKLQRAEILRESHLQEIIRKAQEEEAKVELDVSTFILGYHTTLSNLKKWSFFQSLCYTYMYNN